MKGHLIAALAAIFAIAAPALAQTQAPAPAQAPAQPQAPGDDLWSHEINTAHAGQWNLMPATPRPAFVDSQGVPGGTAMRIRVTARGANAWDRQANSPVDGAIKQGDVVLLMYYARAETPAEGGSVLPSRVQLAAAPYTAVIESQERLTGVWAQHCASAVAAADYAAGSTTVAVHLATAPQTVDLGPVFVFDLGPNFDRATLAHCDND